MSYVPWYPVDRPFQIAMTDEERANHVPGRGVVPKFPFGRKVSEAYRIQQIDDGKNRYHFRWTEIR